MGFHACEYCKPDEKYEHPSTSSGDNQIETDEMIINFPDMVPHYIFDHGWKPPQFFIEAIMGNGRVTSTDRRQTRSVAPKRVENVGYLKGKFEKGSVPAGFEDKLLIIMAACRQAGSRMQTKSLF